MRTESLVQRISPKSKSGGSIVLATRHLHFREEGKVLVEYEIGQGSVVQVVDRIYLTPEEARELVKVLSEWLLWANREGENVG